ncbi:MAG TPA: mechanosensitive ion channel family protein [Tepidisphaeraceae bacterium]|nr:mechanosensitive ion channel family protein [Tepidisphaeraceae bacterium]
MLQMLFVRLLLLAQLMAFPGMAKAILPDPPATANGQADNQNQAANNTGVHSFSSTAPADSTSGRPAAAPADSAHAAPAVRGDSDTLGDAFNRWTIGKLFKGKKKLSPEDLGHIEFWVGLIKEPLLTAISFVPRAFVAGVFLLLFWGVYRGIRRLLRASLAHVDASIRDMTTHLVKWGVMGFGLVIACNQIGIQITALLTGVSIIGLAIGLAAQETLANFIAGIVIFWDKPFRLGENIEIDGICGTVLRVTFRSTRLLTFDGEVVVMPNTSVLASKLHNSSAHPTGRVSINVRISYNASIEAARQALLALTDDDRISPVPAPAVLVDQLGDSGVNLIFRFWAKEKSKVAAMKFEYTEKTKAALDAAGIEIPFPQMQVLLHSTEAHVHGEDRVELRAAG